MSVRINTNVAALSAQRSLATSQGDAGKALERLSSGLRINRAADDAAGLSISEGMRAQVNGLNRAGLNAQDGVSLIQTAEGALNETHAMLQRMRTLAVQAANGTWSASDRANIQAEVTALVKEIDAISGRTQFNGMSLLDGTFTGKSLQIGAKAGEVMSLSIGAASASDIGLSTPTGTAARQHWTGHPGHLPVDTPKDPSAPSKPWDDWDTTPANLVSTTGEVPDGTYTISELDVLDATGAVVGSVSADGLTITLANGTATFDAHVWHDKWQHWGVTPKPPRDGTVTISSELDVSSQELAQAALGRIDTAISNVSSMRADLGALQNRLGHTMRNLAVSAENLAAAESRIRDADMAKEMAAFSRSQILQQAGISMAAQANQASQGLLKLLG